MSARLLKKVLKEQEELQQHHSQPSTTDDEDGQDPGPSPPAASSINPFDLLIDDEDDSQINPQQDDDQEAAEEVSVNMHKEFVRNGTKSASSTSNKKLKKKKKKKERENSSSTTNKILDKPLDVILESLSLDVNPSALSRQQDPEKAKDVVEEERNRGKQCLTSLLEVDPKYLNAGNELRRIFGSKVVKSFEKNNQASSSRQLRGGRRVNHLSRKTYLVSPSDHWPRWDGSLSMEFLETKNGYHYFRYVHPPSYVEAQKAFEAAKSIHDLNGIASILLHHPYHLDSLITMAEYFKFAGDHEMSSDAVAKSLYALECAWHPMFTALQGNCQLKISHETNKPMFTSLFTHVKNLDRRGCHRSALEVCKLLLSLDSDDPMGALFFIDYLSLRAEEYSWLERFAESYKNDTSLWLFPNFSFSLSVCRYYLEREEDSKNDNLDATRANSTDLLKQALMLHPLVLKRLVEKVPLKEQFWVHILKNSFFSSDQTGIPSLDHLINLYVERNYLIWRIPDLQKLLKETAQLVIEVLETDRNDAKDWACVRKEAFSCKKNEYAHLLVSDFSDSVSSAPPEALQDFVVDPRMRDVQNIIQHANPPNQRHPTREIANRSALAVLFESMLPWVNYGDERDIGVDEGNQFDEHDH
ncbi:Transcription factor 25, partial [Cucurbita argyrosperma subsp. sororia]